MDGEFASSNTIQFDDKLLWMEDLCRTSISHTIRIDDKPLWMEDLCRAGISHTIQFDGNCKSMEICARQTQASA